MRHSHEHNISAPLEILNERTKNIKSPSLAKSLSAAASIKNPQISRNIIIPECGIDCLLKWLLCAIFNPDIATLIGIWSFQKYGYGSSWCHQSEVAKNRIFNLHDIDEKYHNLIVGNRVESYGDESADVFLEIKDYRHWICIVNL